MPNDPKPFKPAVPASVILKRDGQVSWRGELRARVGSQGERLWDIILGIAEGTPLTAVLPDGREHVSVPNADTRLKAAIFLAESLFGKAVTQVEQKQAETEADELKAMGDQELERRARDILQRGLAKLEAKRQAALGTDIASDTGSDQIEGDRSGTVHANAKGGPGEG
jgi:hypothetical protein